MNTTTSVSGVYPREARERDLVDFLVANKNKAYNYQDIAYELNITIHTARELIRKLRKEGKILIKYMNESRRIPHVKGRYLNKTQKIAYVTIHRGWLNKHREEINESEANVQKR